VSEGLKQSMTEIEKRLISSVLHDSSPPGIELLRVGGSLLFAKLQLSLFPFFLHFLADFRQILKVLLR